jgi:uncharacterized protein with von Willebrand factor type A (vWA) domain
MLIDFFLRLKRGGLPVSTKEFLFLLEGLKQHVAGTSLDDFYFLARTSLVKDERHFDKFDRIFGEYVKGLDETIAANPDLPLEWLLKKDVLELTDEEKALIEALGGLDKLMEMLRQRLAEQKERHQGGNKWIGTAGTSPYGAYGFNPEGIRIGQSDGRQGSAVKIWEQRAYRNYDDQVELGTRNIKIALRRLRKFAREGAPDELDLDGTIEATARNAGYLDLKMRPERHNTVKVLLFLDAGCSMYSHVRVVEELFSATKTQFKHLEYFYFHNCVYESVWRNNTRRSSERTPTWEILRTYPHDYKMIFVGDASMAPYEITEPGGSIEHNNPEAGATWIRRLTETYPHAIWINPEPEHTWQYRHSIRLLRELMENRMYPLTLEGLERAMKELAK